jgi:hypothetical protein
MYCVTVVPAGIDVLRHRRARNRVELALSERLLEAGLGCLERVLAVLVISRHCELGRCRIHATDCEDRNDDEH